MKTPRLKSLTEALLLASTISPISQHITPADRKTIRRRSESEGLTFVCNLLPSLGKRFDACLGTGRWDTPFGFKTKRNTMLPEFLHEAFARVFDPSTGNLLDRGEIDTDAALAIRQITLMCGKAEFDGNAVLAAECWQKFKANQERLGQISLTDIENEEVYPGVRLRSVLNRARSFVRKLTWDFDAQQLMPRHGSGAAPDHSLPPQRYQLESFKYVPSIDRLMPYSDFLFYNYQHLADDLGCLRDMPVQETFYDKAAFVPKDTKSVRGIGLVEPTLMFFQQAIAKWLKGKMSGPYWKKELDITDQTRNQRWARKGSLDGSVATIDLSDASNSLHLGLIERLFPYPLSSCLLATRADGIVNNGESVKYACFAPQGAATCFPVQTIVFWALCKAASTVVGGHLRPLSSCYGDDIVVSSQSVETVIRVLELVGLIVNRDKTFSQGPFRESCGADYLNGDLVTPVRVRKDTTPDERPYTMSERRFHAVDLFNRLTRRYQIYVSEQVHESFRKICKHRYGMTIPTVDVEQFPQSDSVNWDYESPQYLALVGYDGCVFDGIEHRFNHDIQSWQIRVRCAVQQRIPVLSRPELMQMRFSDYPRLRLVVDSGWSELLRKELLHRDSVEEWDPAYAPRGRIKHTRRWITLRPAWAIGDENITNRGTLGFYDEKIVGWSTDAINLESKDPKLPTSENWVYRSGQHNQELVKGKIAAKRIY